MCSLIMVNNVNYALICFKYIRSKKNYLPDVGQPYRDDCRTMILSGLTISAIIQNGTEAPKVEDCTDFSGGQLSL